jgi:endonuclease YncB( thermonuclease family)
MAEEGADGQKGTQRADCKPLFIRVICGHAFVLTPLLAKIPIRIAGVDAPECAHFGRPAQPFSAEALAFLQSYITGRRVRAVIWKRDQYERVVATVWVRRWVLFRRDVGLEMLRRGLATTYEAKSGAEFGGLREIYTKAEFHARRKKKGMWGAPGVVETPREYKQRMGLPDNFDDKNAKGPWWWRI